MRKTLVMKFCCSACGTLLNLTYDKPRSMPYADGEQPTGALMVENVVSIEPCLTCTKPARDVAEALTTLMRIGGNV